MSLSQPHSATKSHLKARRTKAGRSGVENESATKVLDLILQHFQQIDSILLEKVKDTSFSLENRDYIAMSLFRNCFSSIQLLTHPPIDDPDSRASRNKVSEIGRDLVQFQMHMGLRFTQRPNHGSSTSPSDDEDDPQPNTSKTRNESYIPRPTTPSSEMLSRNRGTETIPTTPTMQSPLPFTTYIPSSEKTPALALTEVPTPVESKKKKKDYVEISRFMQAAEEGDTTLLSNLIEEAIVKGQLKSLSAVGDLRDDDHMNVLDHASACGQVEVMRELILTYGVDVNGADDVNGLTPLHHASRAGQMQAVTFLVLVASADVNHVSLSGLTPSEITTFRRIKDFFEKQKPSGGNSIGSADRFSVPSRQDADAVQDGSDLSVSSSSTSQPVSPAPEWKNRVQGALRRSSVARGTTSTPSSSSNISASASSLPDSTLRNSFRSSQISSLPTSLHSNTATLTLKTNSTSSDERFTQSILLKNFKQSSLKGAPDSVASVFDPSRIFQSVREGDMTRVSNLIEEAIVKGQLKSLSAVGDLRDDDHMNVLDHASACGQVEVIRELILTYGVDVNGADDVNGLTPLHHASRAGQMQAVTFLVLVASADVNHVSLSGLTPSEITSSKRIQKFLLGQKSAGGKGSSAAGSGVGTTGSGSSRNSRGRLQLSSEFHRLESSESLN